MDKSVTTDQLGERLGPHAYVNMKYKFVTKDILVCITKA